MKQHHENQRLLVNRCRGKEKHRADAGSFHGQRVMSSHCIIQVKLRERAWSHTYTASVTAYEPISSCGHTECIFLSCSQWYLLGESSPSPP